MDFQSKSQTRPDTDSGAKLYFQKPRSKNKKRRFFRKTYEFHDTDGAYVMYQANTDNAEALKEKLIPACEAIIQKAEETKVDFIKAEEAKKKFAIPPFIQSNDDVRLVYFGENFALPCGGTDVKNLKDIGEITIRKIKNDRDKIKISYSIVD